MSRLRSRIAGQPAAARAAAGDYHPWGTADTPVVMPGNVTRYASGMTGVEQVIFAPDGRAIPMTGAAGHGAVARAGRA
jgi:hypothetical protein